MILQKRIIETESGLDIITLFGSRGLTLESRTRNPKFASSSLGLAGIVGGGSECTALSPPSIDSFHVTTMSHHYRNAQNKALLH